MAAKLSFDERNAMNDLMEQYSGCDLEDFGAAVWGAATKAAEEKFTSTNTGSPKLPTSDECIATLCPNNEAFSWSPYWAYQKGIRHCHDFICRQLRAGA